MNLNSYKQYLLSGGYTLGQVSKSDSDANTDYTFCDDSLYKRVYILTKDGWKFEDAKYQFHTAKSILRDDVDYYLQFRPKIHYPIGSYVIIPDDTDFDINLSEEERKNPFLQPINERTQWWIIVDRDNGYDDVQYNILKCNWNFKWLYKGKIQEVFGCTRSANSYTNGKWVDEYTASLDNLTSAWLPDTYSTYGNNLFHLGLTDSRTLFYEQRFMITTNILQPKVYQTTKIVEVSPKGILKLSLKQDEYNAKRDNIDLMICDYYIDNGDILVDEPHLIESDNPIRDLSTSEITWMTVNDDGTYAAAALTDRKLQVGKSAYFQVQFSQPNINPEWRVQLVNLNNSYSNDEIKYWEGLMKITKFDNNMISLKPGKANTLKGKHFVLSVSDGKGDFFSSIELEVAE